MCNDEENGVLDDNTFVRCNLRREWDEKFKKRKMKYTPKWAEPTQDLPAYNPKAEQCCNNSDSCTNDLGNAPELDTIKLHRAPLLRTIPTHQAPYSSDELYKHESEQGNDTTTPTLTPCNKAKYCGLLKILLEQPLLASTLLFIPFGFLSYFLKWRDSIIFFTNFFAIIPQAWLMGKATEDLASHIGHIAGGLLNAWFGNAVEMLLCTAGLKYGEISVVKATLVGCILSNLLLVTGCSFFFGGLKHKMQEFSTMGASTNASLMTLSCICLGLPTMYAVISSSSVHSELNMSRTVSFFLVFMYIQYLIFQLVTHAFVFEKDEEEEEADLSFGWSAGLLAGCTILCTFCSKFLVNSISGTVEAWGVSKSFIGIIVFPIMGNAAEHYAAVAVALRNKMDLSLACAIGSSCQMALFVAPFTVLAGWAMGQPMSLDLHPFEMTVLVFSVLIVTSILQDGYSNWLEGSMLLSAYFVVAFIYFFENKNL